MKFSDLADIIRRHAPAGAADLIEAICREAAGETLYIPRRPDRPEIRPADTPAQVQARHGVSRSTAYNWVTRWKR